MIKIIKVSNVEKFAAKILQKQPRKNKTIVESILKNVKKNGDDAIRKYEKKFSGANITSLRLSKTEIKNAYSKVSKDELSAIRLAKARLEKTESVIKSLLKNKTIAMTELKFLKNLFQLKVLGVIYQVG